MCRYQLEILHKSRCILHCEYLTEDRLNPQFSQFRDACIGAAFVTSLHSHDFLLAAMVVCLELHCRFQATDDSEARDDHQDERVSSMEDLVCALQDSHWIWEGCEEASNEVMQAWKSISILLEKASFHSQE
ncbi:uncharacterized protein N7459_009477 [Penicillium hispanicum]|uniref:uncharacterized protein n=1 Tax=Penicillium hispanicum TaxID=1080232 RepID=UPI002542532A|nr:uncharacterized protein N7459_009477 [Penicillium hispanicum]KAJ5570047.1 hypothetical protein N7459_009477 [Penicillium hispanicum]